MSHLQRTLLIAAAAAVLAAPPARAFCGFYVAKADTSLFNQASQVVMVREGDRTVMTMANDYQGDPKEFAIVVPVPTFLEEGQIHVGDRAVVEHLDAFTAPRLVEYFDPDPCEEARMNKEGWVGGVPGGVPGGAIGGASAEELGVTIEAKYKVGEYDILILSAKESDGLETWLVQNGYRMPRGAAAVLGSYIRQNMRFFVAKVNLEEQAKLGYTFLRPLQVAYESPKFMLPIRLGTLNANGPQELFVYALNRSGRIETTNYRTIRLPSDLDVPPMVKTNFSDFYRDLFSNQVAKDGMRAVYLEYAWNMAGCDPCAADPLSDQELRQLGVFWLDDPSSYRAAIFVTRLHVRYTAEEFPEDLVFQDTRDRENFQGRYIIRHPWQGDPSACKEARAYLKVELPKRQEREAQTLASLTGWKIEDIRRGKPPAAPPQPPAPPRKEPAWWEKLWGGI